MRQETFTLSQKELQRVASFPVRARKPGVCQSRGAARSIAAAHQTAQSALSSRQRSGSGSRQPRPAQPPSPAARACAIASCSWPAPATPASTTITFARSSLEQEGFSLSRETLRRLLRSQGLGSPRKRRAPAHRQRRLRVACEGQLVQLDGSPHDWLEGRGPRLTALGMQDDASGKILAAQFFPTEAAYGYLCLLRQLLRRHGVPTGFLR